MFAELALVVICQVAPVCIGRLGGVEQKVDRPNGLHHACGPRTLGAGEQRERALAALAGQRLANHAFVVVVQVQVEKTSVAALRALNLSCSAAGTRLEEAVMVWILINTRIGSWGDTSS